MNTQNLTFNQPELAVLANAVRRLHCEAPADEAIRGELRDRISAARGGRLPFDHRPVSRDPLAGLAPELRAWLVDEMGMQAEMAGGGCYVLRHQGPGGWHMWVSGFDGDLPEPDNWGVGVYSPADASEAVWYEGHVIGEPVHSPSKLSLRQAVAAACSIMVESEAAPEPVAAYTCANIEEEIRHLIADAAEHGSGRAVLGSAGFDHKFRLRVTASNGQRFSVTVAES